MTDTFLLFTWLQPSKLRTVRGSTARAAPRASPPRPPQQRPPCPLPAPEGLPALALLPSAWPMEVSTERPKAEETAAPPHLRCSSTTHSCHSSSGWILGHHCSRVRPAAIFWTPHRLSLLIEHYPVNKNPSSNDLQLKPFEHALSYVNIQPVILSDSFFSLTFKIHPLSPSTWKRLFYA